MASRSQGRRDGLSNRCRHGDILPGVPSRGASSRTVWNAVALQQTRAKELDMPQISISKSPGRGRGGSPKSSKYGRAASQKQTQGKKPETEKERVLSGHHRPLTLSQKLGLSDAPPQPLSEVEWHKVKEKSGIRGDNEAPCPICHDNFDHHRHQVLLSCSHTFHRACLEAFERLSKSKTCPMCRRENYQKRLIFDGARTHKSIAAARIQAAWKGHLTRKWYRQLLINMPAPKDPVLRKRYFERRLTSMADGLVASSRSRTSKVDELLCGVDQVLEVSRKRLAQADLLIKGSNKEGEVQNVWDAAQAAAKKRNEKDCPICMTSLLRCQLPHTASSSNSVLLSCSHVFHKLCLVTMESFSCGDLPTCPVCRSAYIRQDWNMDS